MALYSRDRLSTISTGTFGTPPLYVNHSVNSTNTRGAQYNPSNHTSTMEEKIKRAKAKKAHQIYMENPLKYEGKTTEPPIKSTEQNRSYKLLLAKLLFHSLHRRKYRGFLLTNKRNSPWCSRSSLHHSLQNSLVVCHEF